MKSFEKFKEILLNDGCICSDRAITQVPIHDTIKSGDILILPPNPTFFKKEFSNGNQVEFVLCQDVSTGDLKSGHTKSCGCMRKSSYGEERIK